MAPLNQKDVKPDEMSSFGIILCTWTMVLLGIAIWSVL